MAEEPIMIDTTSRADTLEMPQAEQAVDRISNGYELVSKAGFTQNQIDAINQRLKT